jgi:gliding motility-associated lipoprotein GldD
MKKEFFLAKLMILIILIGLTGCSEDIAPRARPHGFHQILFPETVVYQKFKSEICPFEFTYPASGKISRIFDDSCWVDIDFPEYGLKWHLTHRFVPETGLAVGEHFEEHRKLIYKHSKKATQIAARDFNTPVASGKAWEVYGNVGTPAYYFLADSAQENILMVSFYFNTATKNDSLAPVIEYMRGEVEKSLESLVWRE